MKQDPENVSMELYNLYLNYHANSVLIKIDIGYEKKNVYKLKKLFI